MPVDVNEVPVVGQMYQNCGIVKKIDEVVKDKGNKIHTRKIITLKNGAMYFYDHFIEKPEPPKSSIPKKSKSFPGAATRKNTPPTTRSESEHDKIPDKSGHSAGSGSSNLTPKKENYSPKKEAKSVVSSVPATITSDSTFTGNDSDPKRRDQSNIPLSIIVYSEKDPNLGPATPDTVRGIWTVHEEADIDDEELWKPQEIFLYKPGDDLSTIDEEGEDGSVDTNSLTTGVWGYPKGGAPRAGNEDDWFPLGGEALVVPPQQQAPEDFVPAGKYSFKPGMVSWPPPVDKIKKRLREVGKLKVPKCFEKDGKCPIKVFPRSKLNPDGSPQKSPAKKKKSVSFAPVGQWSYPKDRLEDDDHFLPVDIDLYFGDELPPAATSIGGSEDGSLVSWGLWGTGSTHASPLDVLDDDSSEASWELPVGSLIFPPGVEPDSDVEIQGRWAFPLNENVEIQWPPAATKYATVYPKMFAPDAESGKTQGVWDFEAIDDADKEEWDPQEVELYPSQHVFEEERPHGHWGILQGAEPNEDFDWKPEDVFFCPPGEVPDDDIWIQGKWAFPLDRTWPPPPGTTNTKQRSVGKLKIPEYFKGAKTVPMKIFPRSFLPKETHGKRVGKWAGCGKDELKHLLPQDVELYYGDHEPERPNEPSQLDYGVWGLDEDDISDVSDTDYDVDWLPSNCLVYPPGVAPDPAVRVCGKWTVPGRLKIDWPPENSKSAWVYPRGVAPGTEARKTQGVWKFVHDIAPEKAHKWQPQQIELYSSMKQLDDTRPYGLWGINADAKPDTDLNWDPKDIWFYPPGEEPEANCEKRGIWTFPRGRLDVSWPPAVIESPQRKSRTVGKLKIPGTFDEKGSSRTDKSVGKLKIPSLFSGS
ncbi:MAG: hypothetical protein SGILL_005652 [Bacillariaceae sp.]